MSDYEEDWSELVKENMWLKSAIISIQSCIRAERKPTLDQLDQVCEHTLKKLRVHR